MTGKKTKPPDLAAQIKKDMVNYIGPIFEELKTDMRNLPSRSDVQSIVQTAVRAAETRLNDKINWQGTLIEDVRKEIKTALEATSSGLDQESAIKNHEERINLLERDVKILKTV